MVRLGSVENFCNVSVDLAGAGFAEFVPAESAGLHGEASDSGSTSRLTS
jgi:hypothetical protein